MSTPAPGKVHNAGQRKKMAVDWVNSELDRIEFEDFIHKQSTFFKRKDGTLDIEKYLVSQAKYGREIDAAEHGDIMPLRWCLSAFNPRIAGFINLPSGRKGKVGKRFPKAWKDRRESPELRRAVMQSYKAALILLRTYCKDHHLRKDDVPTANEIAAGRWEVAENEIANWLKHPAKKNPPTKKKSPAK